MVIYMDLYTLRSKITSGTSLNDLNLRVTFYARVSTDKDEQLHSLKAQVSFFQEYISKNPNWEYVDGYIDEGISGTSVNKREAFLQMLKDAENKIFDLILTKEISRFSRNTLDSIKYTQELLKNGVGVYFLNDNINTILPDSELRLTIMASVAQDEVRKLSERVHFGMMRSIDRGVVLGCSNIYGYTKDKGKLVIEEKQAELVKLIYETYATTTISLSGLAKLLEEKGYTNTKGKKIDITIIKRIIKNPKYKGYYCGNKSRIVDYRTKAKKRLDEHEWILYKDKEKCPPLVSEKLWEKANQKLLTVTTSFKNRNIDPTIFQNRYTYSGKIFCAKDKTTYHRSSSGNRKNNPTWECKIYRKYGKKGCDNPKIFEYELDSFFHNLFEKIIEQNHILNNLKDIYIDYLENYDIKTDIATLEKDLNNLNNKKASLIDLVIDNLISKEDYLRKIKELEDKIEKTSQKLTKSTNDINNSISVIERANLLENKLQELASDNQVFKSLFNVLVSKIIVYKEITSTTKSRLKIYLKEDNLIEAIHDEYSHKFHLSVSDTTSNRSISRC